jgi:hypothetical protein
MGRQEVKCDMDWIEVVQVGIGKGLVLTR